MTPEDQVRKLGPMTDDHDETHKAIEERLNERLDAAVSERALAERVAGVFNKLEGRIEAIERKLGEVEGDREALPSDIPKPL